MVNIKDILLLYPEFTHVSGPHTDTGGRLYINLVDSKVKKGSKGYTYNISYPKALMEIKLGERIYEPYTVDRTVLQEKSVAKFENKEMNPFDVEFSEGSKLRISHIRTERSSKLREFYFQHTDNPNHCDMCKMDTQRRYPWAERVLELHHLLPLSSPIRVEKNSSSLKDIVGLCPSCHRATHKYYSK